MSFGELTMYKVSNKSIAALAVFAMLVAGFGAIVFAGGNDAAEAKTADLVMDDDENVMYVVTVTGAADANPDLASYVAVFGAGTAKVIDVTVKFAYKDGKTFEDVPAIYKPYVDDVAKTVSAAEKETFDTVLAALDAAIVTPTANTYAYEIVCFIDTDNFVVTPEQVAELEAYVEGLETQIAELQADIVELQADIVAKEVEIAELEEYIEELEEGAGELIAELKAQVAGLEAQVAEDKEVIEEKNSQIALDLEEIALKTAKIADLEKQLADKKGGDATLAWCVAAIGIIAAIVLAGFILIVFNKANKEGRRLL